MWSKFAILLCLCGFAFTGTPSERADRKAELTDAIQEYIDNNFTPTPHYKEVLQGYNFEHLFRREKEDYPDKGLLCDSCALFLDTVIYLYHNGTSRDELRQFFVDSCINLNIEPGPVCEGVIDMNIDIILYIVDSKPDGTGVRGCAQLLQNAGCTAEGYGTWDLEVPIGIQFDRPAGSGEAFKILQVSDIHYDPVYTVGSATQCKAPVCCEYDSGELAPGDDGAAYWSEYNCDSPIWMIEDSLQQIAERHPDIDYIYFTGDIVSHRIWITDIYNNSKDIKDILNLFAENFAVPVYPILGNHEPHPLNVWSSEGVNNIELSTQWVFDLVAEIWLTWLPADTEETIRKGGYYTVKVRDGFRLIALNSNVCYTYNWWLMYDDVDPYGQLAWMIQVLAQAEKDGENVHIISHIPSGDGTCNTAWAKVFKKIIKRFSNTVTGIFNGHSHNDEMIVYFPKESTDEPAFSVAYNGASLTTYTNKNPSYKIYDVDTDNFDILNYVEWACNITQANLRPDVSPTWYELYKFKEAYGVTDMKPETIGQLVERMAVDHSLLELYNRYMIREADPGMQAGCGLICQKNHMCDIVTSVHDDKVKCDQLTADWQL